jgi:hypothetical protein
MATDVLRHAVIEQATRTTMRAACIDRRCPARIDYGADRGSP